jgi:hypothetical protein
MGTYPLRSHSRFLVVPLAGYISGVRPQWLDFAFVNISSITDSENKNICAYKGINYSIVTKTKLAQPGKSAFEYGV